MNPGRAASRRGFAFLAVLLVLLVLNGLAVLAGATALHELRIANAGERGLRLDLEVGWALEGAFDRSWPDGTLPGPHGLPDTLRTEGAQIAIRALGPETFFLEVEARDSLSSAVRRRASLVWGWSSSRILPDWASPWRVVGAVEGAESWLGLRDGVGTLAGHPRPLAPLDLALGWRPGDAMIPPAVGSDSVAAMFGIRWLEGRSGSGGGGARNAIRDTVPALRVAVGDLFLVSGDTLRGFLWAGGDVVVGPGSMLLGGGRILGSLRVEPGGAFVPHREAAVAALRSSPVSGKLLPLPVHPFPFRP